MCCRSIAHKDVVLIDVVAQQGTAVVGCRPSQLHRSPFQDHRGAEGMQIDGRIEIGRESRDRTIRDARGIALVDLQVIPLVVQHVRQGATVDELVRPIQQHRSGRILGAEQHLYFIGVLTDDPFGLIRRRDVGLPLGRTDNHRRLRQGHRVRRHLHSESIVGGRKDRIIGAGRDIEAVKLHLVDQRAMLSVRFHDDVRTDGFGSHRIGNGDIEGLIVPVIVTHGVKAQSLCPPFHRITAPFAVVAVEENEHVANPVPGESALVEHNFVPAYSGRHVTCVNEGHVGGDMRNRVQFPVGHVGHPDAEAMLGIARSVVAIPTQARHRGGGHTG